MAESTAEPKALQETAADAVPDATVAASDVKSETAPEQVQEAGIAHEATTPLPTATEAQATPVEPTNDMAKTVIPPSAKEELTATEEKQNTLTSKFTNAEWAALKEFRKQLPDVFAEAFPDKPDAKVTPITLWGVVIVPHNASEDPRVSVILVKFLRARNLNVKEGRAMLVNTLRWRDEFKIDAITTEEFPQDLFGALGHVFKTDKEGRPVVYNIYGGNKDTKAIFSDVKRFIRWRVKLMELTVAQCDFDTIDQTVQIHDYEGVSLSDRDANSKQAASEASNIFSSHYPELLYKKYFVNVPTLMTWIFWAFKAIIPSATFAKMAVVGSSKHEIKKTFLPIIDEENLPTRYGGVTEAGF